MLLPTLTQRFPTLGDGPVSDIRPAILLDWSIDIDVTQFTNPVTLPNFVILQQEDTNTNIPLVYTDYIPGLKRLILTPNIDLPRGTQFRVIVNRLIKDSFGRKSDQQYLFQFLTDTAAIFQPTGLDPQNFVVATTFPTFTWNETATGMNYEFVLSTDPSLNDPVIDTTVPTTSYTPFGTFNFQTTYYWKVRAYSTTATGAWSDTNTFFYGTVELGDPSSSIFYGDIQTFELVDTLFEDKSSLLATWPDNITLVFSTPPASNFSNYIKFTKIAQIPRNDVSTSYAYANVAGSWVQNGNNLTFTPTEGMTINTRYDIIVDEDLLGVNGIPLRTEQRFYFSSRYDPFYVHPRVIRMNLGAAEQHIPDDMLNMMIYNASLDAKARFYGYLTLPINGQMLGDLLKESNVRDSNNLNSYGALRWVEANVVYNIIKLIHMESLRKVGLSRTLEGYSESLSEAYVKSLDLALKLAAEEIAKWDDYLIPSDIPSSVVRSADYPVQMIRDWDQSIPTEAARGDSFGGGWWR